MEETTTQARQYCRSKIRLTILQLVLTVFLLVLLLLSGASRYLKRLTCEAFDNFYLQVGLFLFVFGLGYHLLFMAVDFYSGYVLEHRFHLSNETVGGWLK